MRVTCGIDYSMTSPAVCIHYGDSWSIDGCWFYFRTGVKKNEVKVGKIQGTLIEPYKSEEERFYNSAKWVERILETHETPSIVSIEGYAMGAKGKVFHIGENTGQLKLMLWQNNLPFIVPPPTVIKKFATGKGNADKHKMEEAFLAETGVSIRTLLAQSENQMNPSSDIIDAYYMCKYAHHNPPKS
jgi:Holliday junction resolvasome RuvABC endonuclease subunit